jgi:GNAT superfamily N-acetyltransferase
VATFTIRDATAGDIDRIGELHFAARWWAYRGFLPEASLAAHDPVHLAHWWRERVSYEVPPHRLRVVAEGDKVLGFCYSGPSDRREPGTGMINAVHVDPGWHRHGLGRLLLDDALDAMRDSGWHQARLWVLAGNENARRFYERHGWMPTGDSRDDFVGEVLTEQVRYGITLDRARG